MTHTQLIRAVAGATGESPRTVARLGFGLAPHCPADDLEPEDLLLVLDCPFCGHSTELVGGPVHVGAYGLIASEDPAPAVVPAPPMKPALDEGPHLSYALQWIVFAIMAFAALGWAVRQEVRIRRGELPAEPRRTRGPTDADIEDAQLDRVTN